MSTTYMSLSQALDNHTQWILYMYNISQYVRYQNFLTPNYWYLYRPAKIPYQLGPNIKYRTAVISSLGFYFEKKMNAEVERLLQVNRHDVGMHHLSLYLGGTIP